MKDSPAAAIVSAGFGALGVIMARGRHRNGLLWGVLGALFPMALLILLLLPKGGFSGRSLKRRDISK